MNNNREIELIEIFIGTPWQAGIVKSLLEDASIEAFLNDEIMGTIAPWNTGTPSAGSVKVVVSSDNLVSARLIVDDFEKNIQE